MPLSLSGCSSYTPCWVTGAVTPHTSSFSLYTGLLEAEPLSYLLVPSKGPILFRGPFPSLHIGGAGRARLGIKLCPTHFPAHGRAKNTHDCKCFSTSQASGKPGTVEHQIGFQGDITATLPAVTSLWDHDRRLSTAGPSSSAALLSPHTSQMSYHLSLDSSPETRPISLLLFKLVGSPQSLCRNRLKLPLFRIFSEIL